MLTAYMCQNMCVYQHMYMEVRGQLSELGLTFHHVSTGDRAQEVRFACKCLYPLPLGHLTHYYY